LLHRDYSYPFLWGKHAADIEGSASSPYSPLFHLDKDEGFGPTSEGRYLTIVFELKAKGIAQPITGRDMSGQKFDITGNTGDKR